MTGKDVSKVIVAGLSLDLITKALAHWLLSPGYFSVQNGFLELTLTVNRSGLNSLTTAMSPESRPPSSVIAAVAIIALVLSAVTAVTLRPNPDVKTRRKVAILTGVLLGPFLLASLIPLPDKIGSFAVYFQRVPALVAAAWVVVLFRNKMLRAGCALIIAGGLGNLLSQIISSGGITDFIGFPPLYGFIGIANFADFENYAGVFLVLLTPLDSLRRRTACALRRRRPI